MSLTTAIGLKSILPDNRCSYPCGILQSEQYALWISRYGKKSMEGWHSWITFQVVSTSTWGPCEGHHGYLRTSLLSLVLTAFTSGKVREVFHFLKLWNLSSVPWTMRYFSAMARTLREGGALSWVLFSFRIMTFLIFFIQCHFLPHVPLMVLLPSGFSEYGVAVRSGYEFQLFPVVPV